MKDQHPVAKPDDSAQNEHNTVSSPPSSAAATSPVGRSIVDKQTGELVWEPDQVRQHIPPPTFVCGQFPDDWRRREFQQCVLCISLHCLCRSRRFAVLCPETFRRYVVFMWEPSKPRTTCRVGSVAKRPSVMRAGCNGSYAVPYSAAERARFEFA